MGLHFGNLGVKVRGIVSYRLSPFEQKPLAGVLSHGLPNLIRRMKEEIFFVVPPFAIGYMVYTWGEAEYEKNLRKKPGEFDHEK
ncbi:unnamed protein product [Notodromas monacha]|uniref:Cytochrome b-c1 complex subunit 8 n=1 Tax=Notodromas monacha TaxID=399045 RepID=A0A7R9BYE7_9CRUS|nr:unnamed protein product [Notodromas monacha]CAG0924075.1 unnamed protein product [Notodromas monacha]